jgi:hypothetical protein
MLPSHPLGVADPNFIPSKSISPNTGPVEAAKDECGDGIKDKTEKCERYLNPINRCCTARCQFAKGLTVCKKKIPCYKKARCSRTGICRGRQRRPNYSKCTRPGQNFFGACFYAYCDPNRIPFSQKKLKKLRQLRKKKALRSLNRDLATDEDEEDEEESEEDFTAEKAYLDDLEFLKTHPDEGLEPESTEDASGLGIAI